MKEHAYRAVNSHVMATQGPGSEQAAHHYAKQSEPNAYYIGWMPDDPAIEQAVASAAPSTRAAVILSAAGIPLKGAS